MLICELCTNPFPVSVIIEGKKRNLQNRRYCLGCSPWKFHNTKELVKPKTEKIEVVTEKICYLCRETKSIENFYADKSLNKKYSSYCKSCATKDTVRRARDLKRKCVEYKGGKCELCGYDRYLRALEFHHRNPEEKDFSISHRPLRSFSQDIKDELDKCMLLCANCHREEHGRLADEE